MNETKLKCVLNQLPKRAFIVNFDIFNVLSCSHFSDHKNKKQKPLPQTTHTRSNNNKLITMSAHGACAGFLSPDRHTVCNTDHVIVNL